jgi:tetratricopeptide (TPR) repeat protein
MKLKNFNYSLLIIAAFIFISCSESADVLIQKGDYDKAIIILKEDLSKDYKNTSLRNKITKLYFTSATRNIEDNNLEEAERNIERGIIYSDENNPEIKDEYADILVLLGSKLIKTGDKEGSVDLKKKYEKGVSLIRKAVGLSENNEAGKAILNTLKKEEAQRYFDLAQVDFNSWSKERRNLTLLTESYKNLMLSIDIMVIPEAEQLKMNLLEHLLSQNIKTNPYDIRYLEVFFNSLNGYTAFRIRFHNNSNRDVVLSPAQFTLYDTEEKSYKFDVVAAKKGNYKGLLESMKINPDRFATGLLVFDTDHKKPFSASKMVWQDDLGNTYTKLFPKILVTELKFE